MDDDKTLRDELAALRNEIGQMRAQLQDMHTVLLGPTSTSTAHDSAFDPRRILSDGARAYVTGLSTSPHREGSKEEHWWRFGWQLAKDAVKGGRGEW